MPRIFQKYWPVLFLFIFWLGFSYPFFLQSKVPYPSTYQVDFFSPWSRYSGYDAPVKNNAMPDVIDQIYPWKYFSIEQLKKGSVPLWNPYSFSGTPHMANYQTAVFSPFTFLYFLLPFIDAWSLIILLQPLLAGLFSYLYLREIKVSQPGSLIGSITFMFSGFMVVWMAYGTLSMVMAFLPLILYFIERSFTKKTWVSNVAISIFISFSLLSGHFQMSLYIIEVVILYIFYKSYSLSDFKNGILTCVYVALGIGLAMFQLLPTMELYANAFRSRAFNTGGGIPFYNLVTALAPDFFGNPVTRNNKFLDYAEWQAFTGIIPLFLAVFAVFKRKSLSLFFVTLGIFAVVLSVASPLQTIIGSLHIPVISTSVQSRIIVVFSFSVAMLAGFGFDSLQARIQKKQYKEILIRILIFVLFFGIIWGLVFSSKVLPFDELQIAKKNFVLPTGVFLIAILSIIGTLFMRRRFAFACLTAVLIGLCSFESFRFANKWMPFDPKSLVFPDEKVTTFLQKNKGYSRVFGNLGGQTAIYYGLPSVDGYDSLYIQRYGEFISSASRGKLTDPINRVVSLNTRSQDTDRVLNLLGVSLFFHPIADTNANWAYPVWDKSWMQSVYKDSSYAIYINTQAIQRAKMFYSYKTIQNKEKIIETFYNPKFDYKNMLILEDKSPILSIKNTKNSLKINRFEPNKIVILVTTENYGMLFLSDPYYPGWKASVDGKETKIYRADYAFRAIPIEKGKHIVVFSYEPLSFTIGLIISGLSVIALLILKKTMQVR